MYEKTVETPRYVSTVYTDEKTLLQEIIKEIKENGRKQ